MKKLATIALLITLFASVLSSCTEESVKPLNSGGQVESKDKF